MVLYPQNDQNLQPSSSVTDLFHQLMCAESWTVPGQIHLDPRVKRVENHKRYKLLARPLNKRFKITFI